MKKLVAIKDFAEFIRTGKTPPTKETHYFGGDIQWFTPGDLDKSRHLTDSRRTLTKLSFDDKKAVRFPSDTLLVACIGDIGKLGITTKECSSNQQITGIKPKNNVDISYLYYWFLQSKKMLKNHANNAVVPILNNRTLEQIQVPLPPLAEQKQIVAILDAADKLRQKDQQLVEHYTALSQSLFLEMFGDPVANSMGWQKTNLGELLKIVRGGSPRPINEYLGGDYPWIKIGDATKGNDIYIEKTKEHIIEEGLKKTRLLPAGSIIFANCGVSLGFARIITFEGCIHDGWLAFSDINESFLNKIFLLKALNAITEYFRDSAPDGTQPNLNTTIMKNFGLILPPIKLQNKFAQSIASIEKQKQQAQANLQKSEALFNSLLQRAFTGELTANKAA